MSLLIKDMKNIICKDINQEIFNKLKQIEKNLPKFEDGRIDYSNSKTALVLTCFIQVKNEILILKRSDKIATYKGMWNTVAGYIDDYVPLKEKVLEELNEELFISESQIEKFKIGNNYEFTDKNINKTWIIYPVLITLSKKPEIKLNWEHIDYKWINPKEIINYDTVPKLDESLKNALN